jgi:hypothetical protein
MPIQESDLTGSPSQLQSVLEDRRLEYLHLLSSLRVKYLFSSHPYREFIHFSCMLDRPLCIETRSYKPLTVEFVYSLSRISFSNEEERVADNSRSIALNKLYIASKSKSRCIYIPKGGRVKWQPNKTWSIPEIHSSYISAENISCRLSDANYKQAVMTKNGCNFLLPMFASLLAYNPCFAFEESLLDRLVFSSENVQYGSTS